MNNELIDPGEHPDEPHAIAPVNDPASIMAAAVQSGNPEMVKAISDAYIQLESNRVSRQAVEDFNAAKTNAVSTLPAISKDGKNNHNSTQYATLDNMLHTVQPTLYKHGLSVDFTTDFTDGRVVTTCHLRHTGGHSIECAISLPADKGPQMNSTQACGSAFTYGRRYSLAGVLGLAIGDEYGFDDDGEAANVEYCETLTEKELNELTMLLEENGRTPQQFAKFLKVDTLADARKTPEYLDAVAKMEAATCPPK